MAATHKFPASRLDDYLSVSPSLLSRVSRAARCECPMDAVVLALNCWRPLVAVTSLNNLTNWMTSSLLFARNLIDI